MGDPETGTGPDRRPIKARSARWVQDLASRLVAVGVSPNQISASSVVFAAIGGALLLGQGGEARSGFAFIGAALCIQLRLLANVLDGLVAVEGGRASKVGELYNEIPDRAADILFLAAAGYAARHGGFGVFLGWAAASLAVTTAYIRALGARRGFPQDFSGPQAKQQRMFLLTVGCVAAAFEVWFGMRPRALEAILVVIAAGTLLTCIHRTMTLAGRLEGP
jgi:phosphatidylglycerophosphate synthase